MKTQLYAKENAGQLTLAVRKVSIIIYLIELVIFCLILFGALGVMAQEKEGFLMNKTKDVQISDFKKFDVIKIEGNTYLNLVVQNLTAGTTVYFVERSSNNYDFTIINFKEGIASPLEILYSWIDKNPPLGKVYYRIREVSHDGIISVSAIHSVGSDGTIASK